MKLEVGKYYRTRNGNKVFLHETKVPGCAGFGDPFGLYLPDGKFGYMENGVHCCGAYYLDIIAEWTDTPEAGPVRTVTRLEIVPGKYGNVTVWGDGWPSVKGISNTDELAAAIATLTAIRDAMLSNATA